MSMMVNPYPFGAGGGGGSDPNWADVKLLCGFAGADGSTTITDESSISRTLTAVGNAQIDTAQSKFGGSSLLLDGTGDYVSAPDSADFEFGSGQFTVEGFFRFSNLSNSIGLLDHYDGSGGWGLYVNGGALQLNANGGAYLASYAGWLSVRVINQWYHIAVDRAASGKVRLYLDGVMVASNTATTSFGTSTTLFGMGRLTYVNLWHFNGAMDEVRITKGVSRYASDSGFTVPTAAYPRS